MDRRKKNNKNLYWPQWTNIFLDHEKNRGQNKKKRKSSSKHIVCVCVWVLIMVDRFLCVCVCVSVLSFFSDSCVFHYDDDDHHHHRFIVFIFRLTVCVFCVRRIMFIKLALWGIFSFHFDVDFFFIFSSCLMDQFFFVSYTRATVTCVNAIFFEEGEGGHKKVNYVMIMIIFLLLLLLLPKIYLHQYYISFM